MKNRYSGNIIFRAVSSFWFLLFLSFAIIFLFWFFYPYLIERFFLKSDSLTGDEVSYVQLKGAFGDQFGALSSLFSGLAFAGIIYTILLQRNDLVATRREVELQNKNSEKQIFENTLFQMLFSRKDILRDLEILGDGGRKALGNYWQKVIANDADFSVFIALKKLSRDQVRDIQAHKDVEKYSSILTASEISTIQESLSDRPAAIAAYFDADETAQRQKLELAAVKATEDCMDELSHYLRYTFWIYKNIERSSFLKDEEKINYANMVRSQLSDVEIAAIFYVVIVSGESVRWSDEPVSIQEMKKLALRFKVLSSLNERFWIHATHKSYLK